MSLISKMTKLAMSSREIAALTGKDHNHVVRDINNMLTALGVNHPVLDDKNNVGVTHHMKEYRGRTVTDHIDMSKDLTLTLVTGYSVKDRLAVVKRWQQLEQSPIGREPVEGDSDRGVYR